jgi:hypothetical protein
MAAAVTAVAGITIDWRWPEALFRRTHRIRIAARVLNVDRFGGQYLVTVQLPRERYTGTSDRFSFGAIKPHLASYRSGWLDLAYEKDPRLKPGQSFPLWATE